MKNNKEQDMKRLPGIKRLLFVWFKWRNKCRNSLPCALDITNDVVDTSRGEKDLINADSVDFDMLSLERAIAKLDITHQRAVFAMYGQKTWLGTVGAAKLLSISRKNLHKLLCEADVSISDNLTAENNAKNKLREKTRLHFSSKKGTIS